MRVVFMGTPEFAVPSLEALARQHEVLLVVTRPGAASGRGGKLRPSVVKAAALAAGLPVIERASLRGEANDAVASAHPDVICVAAFGVLLPPETLAVPPLGCVNVHASLLPSYRGAAPVQRAILAGDTETGVSIMRMEEGLDTGPYALQHRVPVAGRYANEVEEEIARVGAGALLEVLSQIEAGSVVWESQDETAATYAAKVTKDDTALAPGLGVAEAWARVRASTRRAPARVVVGDAELTVVRAHPVELPVRPGEAALDVGVPVLGFADCALALEIVRPAGRGDMTGDAWARGVHIASGTSWRSAR